MSNRIKRQSRIISAILNSILILRTFVSLVTRFDRICKRLELTISHQTNLNHLYGNEKYGAWQRRVYTEHPYRQLSICYKIIYTFQYSDSAGKFIVNMHAVLMNMNMRKLLCQRRDEESLHAEKLLSFRLSVSLFFSLYLFIYLFISFSLFSFLIVFPPVKFIHNFSKSSKRQDFMRMSGKVAHLVIDDRNQICANRSHLKIMMQDYMVLQQTIFQYTECLCNAFCCCVTTTILLLI